MSNDEMDLEIKSVACCTDFIDGVQMTVYEDGNIRFHVKDRSILVGRHTNPEEVVELLNGMNIFKEGDLCDCYEQDRATWREVISDSDRVRFLMEGLKFVGSAYSPDIMVEVSDEWRKEVVESANEELVTNNLLEAIDRAISARMVKTK